MPNTPIIPITLVIESASRQWKTVVPCLRAPSVEPPQKTWLVRQAVVLDSRNLVLEVWGETDHDGSPKTDALRASILDVDGNVVNVPYTVLRRRWKEVVRVDNQGTDTAHFDQIKRWYLAGFVQFIGCHFDAKSAEVVPEGDGYDMPVPGGSGDTQLLLNAGRGIAVCRSFDYHGNYEAFYLMRSFDEPLEKAATT